MNRPNTPGGPATTPGIGVTRASRDNARASASFATMVWRITADATGHPDATAIADADHSTLTSPLARHIVEIYTEVHGPAIDLDADIDVGHAAETTGRHSTAVTQPTDPAGSADAPRPAALIMLRRPPPAATAQGQDADRLLTACRQHLADVGSAVIIPLDAEAGRDAFTYAITRDTAAPSHDNDSDVGRQATCTTLVIFGHPRRRP